ncbi:CPBP family intramembrane metalloprotease [Nocardioides humilatus]|uniref:CPBP family intramembrane metalloprotease n=1 Tax=Nocardioides humilatus TaxID=2607660 RepID=A0A5B1LJQ5_9ACTN|nr:CPBP family intramembrane glutamic endopeptidase [Nocardioides humilatus]KAA1420951.1 CPBP family intramembrane metalloprotease [Nocardioides humilatus]
MAATWCAGTALLRRSLATEPGSREFYVSTAVVAGVWGTGHAVAGGEARPGGGLRHSVVTPLAVSAGAFATFYGGALVARRIPPLDAAIGRVLAYAVEGDTRLVLVTTLANGVGEELFFRGAWYDALGGRHPVLSSTLAHAASTSATGNPALTLAAVVMGGLFGLQRRSSGGVVAPAITHLTWSALMVRFVTPLYRRRGRGELAAG